MKTLRRKAAHQRFQIKRIQLAMLGISLALMSGSASADTIDFGGNEQEFKGAGDKVPPQCQIELPTSASEPFFIQWSCEDNFSPTQDLQSELWITRKDAPAAQLLGKFLGFPASVQIDPGALGTVSLGAGLPATFRLLARDRAGNLASTDPITVIGGDTPTSSCELRVNAVPTGETSTNETGVVLSTDALESQELSASSLLVRTTTEQTASPCTIDALCQNEQALTFTSQVDLSGAGTVSGTLSIAPGDIAVALAGTAETTTDGKIASFNATGSGTVDGEATEFALTCTNGSTSSDSGASSDSSPSADSSVATLE